jgi:threonine/homoserine/homoserine lactone efflux protein
MFEFALASLILIAIPGPDQALIVRNSLVGGRADGLRTMFGGASGLLVHSTAAVLGLSALLAASTTAYTSLKVAGVAYLLYLGVRMLRAAGTEGEKERQRRGSRPYAQGLLSNLMNPKLVLFFLTFLPQFLPDHGPRLPMAVALALVFEVLYLVWFMGLIAVVDRVGDWLRRPRPRAWMDRASGSALVGFAARLAASSHA